MTHPTEIETLQAKIQSVPEIMALVNGVAEEAEFRESTAGTRDPTSVALSLVAVAALWKLLSVGIGTLRRMTEDATVQRRIQLIRELQEMGYAGQAPLIVDRLAFFDLHRNPFYQTAEVALWMAYRDGRPVGRIAACVDAEYVKFHEEPTGSFGFYESVDDPQVDDSPLKANLDVILNQVFYLSGGKHVQVQNTIHRYFSRCLLR